MFGAKKKKILSEGIQARAVVINVQDTGITINDNPRVRLTLQVQPEGETPFEVTKKHTVSRVAIPRVGDQFLVRYNPADPSTVEFDIAAVAQANKAAQAKLAEAAASQLPADLAAGGIAGRGACVEVQKTPIGQLVDCAMTVGVRLVDGTPAYRTSCRVSLSPENAAQIESHQTLFAVRADPQNHLRIAVSIGETIPTITVNDASVVDPPIRALREGVPCRVQILAHGPQFIRLPGGEDLYATKVRVVEDGSETQFMQPVPAGAASLLVDGKELPARRVLGEPSAMTIDWDAARVELGTGALVA